MSSIILGEQRGERERFWPKAEHRLILSLTIWEKKGGVIRDILLEGEAPRQY